MNSAESTISHPPCGKSDGQNRLVAWHSCSGCAACKAVCPKDAISMIKHKKNGFFYPQIDEKTCIDCGKCSQICAHIHKAHESTYYARAYAAVNRDDDARFRSASGAIFEALAESMLDRDGLVAGVVYTDNFRKAKHVLIGDKTQLPALCGTKYFQSDMSGVYEEIDRAVKEKAKNVFFCGTPCQVRAVKEYAGVQGISERLYTADLICRGVPSGLAWQKYLEYIESRDKKKIKEIKMKDKERGWDKIGVMITFADGSRAYEKLFESVFERSFIQTNLAIRESCFSCPYKTIHREGDVTIGDFWGLRNTRLLEGNMGTSLLLVNSPRGEELFRWVEPAIDYKPSTMWRVWRGNQPAFCQVGCDAEQRELFWKLLGAGKNLKEAVEEAYDSKEDAG